MSEQVTPAPGLCFVRKISTEETYRGGRLVIPEQARDKIAKLQFEVVAVGEEGPCEDDDCERSHDLTGDLVHGPYQKWHWCDLKPGDWVLVRNRSWQESPDPDILIVRQIDIVGRFEVRS